MTEQEYIQRIKQLEFELQQKTADYVLLHKKAKALVDASINHERTPRNNQKAREASFAAIYACKKALKELIYPQTKPSYQAKIDWLGQ